VSLLLHSLLCSMALPLVTSRAQEVFAKVILSPNIFLMVMEFWSISIDIALAVNSLKPMKRIDRTNASHILFAVDMLVFCKGHEQSTNTVNELLEELRLFTDRNGKVFFRKGYRDKLDIANVLGIPLGSLPIKYLGLPLFISYPKPRHFSSLIDKMRTRIDGWMVKSLSAAGRAELIRSVLHNILAY